MDLHNNGTELRHVYIIGAKNIGQYGGYESFIMNLLQMHKDLKGIQYHIACKLNGQGAMAVDKLPGAERINEHEFSYCGAQCFMVKIPEKSGPAQAIFYDINALKYVCKHIRDNHITNPIVYILASRIGPFEKKYVKRIHAAGGLVYQNPDGHEDWRRKWNFLIRKYWKFSEKYAVRRADLVVCDSKNIEKYIKEEYSKFNPDTVFIAYGAHTKPSALADDSVEYSDWLTKNGIDKPFYCCVGRFVEENNYEIMLREFMRSHTDKYFVVITTEDAKYAAKLKEKLHYENDSRIKFVKPVYEAELLKKIRENAYAYFHGHEVGGTNPSLLEALGSTKLNLLLDVGFNREVAEDAALYWTKEDGNLAGLIDRADELSSEELNCFGEKAKDRIRTEYSWEYICGKYEKIFAAKL